MEMKNFVIFISSWHTDPGCGGIHTVNVDFCGKPEIVSHAELSGAGYLAFSPDKKVLYATCEVDNTSDGVAAFAIKENHSLEMLDKPVASRGESCCHLTVSPDGRFLYAANYISGTFAEFSINSDGSVNKLLKLTAHTGSGPDKSRQSSAHPHCCIFSPDGRFLTVADLGNDTLYAYPYSAENGIDAANPVMNRLTAGYGPRHILFDPAGDIVYVIMELANTIASYRFDQGKFFTIDELELLPRGVSCPTKAAALRFSADRNFIVCSNRGFDSLATVELDGNGGLFPAAITLSGGSSPRDINFIGEQFFASANKFSDEVRFFDFDHHTGILTPNGFELHIPQPRCIIQL